MAELLLELFSEEIPARMQAKAAEDLRLQAITRLQEAQIAFSSVQSFVTPRRLVVVAGGIPAIQPDVVVEKKGPKVGAPQPAIDGFLKSVSQTLDQLEVRTTDKGDFYFSTVFQQGMETRQLIGQLVEGLIAAITWPKSMRWGDSTIRWVRPLQNILCVFDGDIVPVTFGHLHANNFSYGHRFLSTGHFCVDSFADYQEQLRDSYVLLDREDRKHIIGENADKLAKAKGFTVKPDVGLLEEVAGLAEWPVVLMGKIDEQFMDVPKEVLSVSMRSHQKYFSVLKNDGELAPYFITVANMDPSDGGAKIIAGNERVLRARLSDARFFWDQDRRKTLHSRVPLLDKMLFHAKLGTLRNKTDRITQLAETIAAYVPGAHNEQVERAAFLCKADLITEMVTEFPELQGIMGSYYAAHDKEDSAVVDAIAEHYRPLGPADACPTKPASIAVALADKIDSLTGLFAAGEKPTGSKDPFALRRAALGIIRIILENKLNLPLATTLEKSLLLFQQHSFDSKKDMIIAELLEFFADRLKASLKSQSVRHDLINAVFDGGEEDNLLRLVERVTALQRFLDSSSGKAILAAYIRATSIVRLEEKKDNASYHREPSPGKLEAAEEQTLFNSLERIKPSVRQFLGKNQFSEAMAALEELQTPINNFFDRVIVNADNAELRTNRLRLLAQIRNLLDGVANFEKIEG